MSATATNKPPLMRADFVSALLNATVSVVNTMAEVATEPGRPYLKTDRLSRSDVTGIIGLAGEGVRGAFAIGFDRACILHIVSGMLGEEVTELDDDIRDAVGELSNMVSGAARATLDELYMSFDMAVPTVICALQHDVPLVTKAPVIVIPFTTEAGKFFTEATLWRATPRKYRR